MLTIDMLRPLTPLEQDYKQLYDRYQVAHQSHLTGVQSLLDQLSSYPDYPAAYQRHFGQHPPYENMDESLFTKHQPSLRAASALAASSFLSLSMAASISYPSF